MTETLPRANTLDRAVIDLHARLDPEHRIPDSISFDVVESTSLESSTLGSTWEKFYIEEHGEPIGSANLIINHGNDTPEDNYGYLDEIKLHHSYRGKGIGLATYMWAIERSWEAGVPFRTQTVSQSPDAKRMWEFLESKGVAICEQPFELDYHRDGKDRFMGKYIVPVPKR